MLRYSRFQQPGTPTQIVEDIKEIIEEDSSGGATCGTANLPFGSYKISRNGGFGTLKRLESDKEVRLLMRREGGHMR